MRTIFLATVAAMAIASCQTKPPPEMIWIRTDGQSGRENPALAQQFQIDETICRGETQRAGISAAPVYTTNVWDSMAVASIRGRQMSDVLVGCMASRGYLLVPKEEAEAKAAALRAAASSGAIVKKPGT